MNSTVDVLDDAIVHRFRYRLRAAGSYSQDVLDRYELLDAVEPIDRPVRNPFGSAAGTFNPLNAATGNLTRRLSGYLGMEYRLGRRYGIPLRAGVRVGGMGAVSMAVGIGFHTPIWEFGLSAAATPSSEVAGGGMLLTVGASVLTFWFGD